MAVDDHDVADIKAEAAAVEDTRWIDDHMPEVLRSYTPAELDALEKTLVRKIDLRSLPILIILFLLNILDRNAIANARLGGLEDTLGLGDTQYQTAVMILWGTHSLFGDEHIVPWLTAI